MSSGKPNFNPEAVGSIPRIFATGNPNKAREIQQILEHFLEGSESHISIQAQKIPDLPEHQSTLVHQVAGPKAVAAFEYLGEPVLVEDSGLYIPHYSNQFPGALYKFMQEGPGNKGILKMMDGMTGDARKAVAVTVFAYHDGEKTHLFQGEMSGHIALVERGQNGFGYDTIVEVKGRTLAEMIPEEKNTISMRRLALQALVEGREMSA